ncbi:hypothetical protein GGI21_000755 [Coemansia aciculifera]|nr:hypothetical protein GGI21_000755 [Coemansia aciculifera]
MSGVSRRFPSLVQLAILVEASMALLKDVVKRLSKGGVSGDQKLLEGLSEKLRVLDMLSLLESLQTEINHDESATEETAVDGAAVVPDALGLRDRQVVAQALDLLVLFEITPRLFPGVGVPIAKRSSSRSEAVDVLNRLNQGPRQVSGGDSVVDLGQIAGRLVAILDKSPRRNAGDMAAVLAAKHTPDLLAVLLQVAYAPLPPPPNDSYYVEQDAERRVELRRAFTRVFDATSAYLLFESLTSLLNAASTLPTGGGGGGGGNLGWFRTLCGRFLSRVLMRPNGVRIAADYLVGNDSELTTDKLHRISSLLLTPPANMPSREYFAQVLPQVIRMAEILQSRSSSTGEVDPGQKLYDDIMDTKAANSRVVQVALYALRQLPDKDRTAFSTYVAAPVIAPLIRCFDTKPIDDAGESEMSLPVQRPLIEVIDSTSEPQSTDKSPMSEPMAVSTAAELAATLDAIKQLVLGGGVPSAAMLAELVVPAFAPLLSWLSFESKNEEQQASSRADILREILVATLCHLPCSAAITTVLNAVQTTFGSQTSSSSDKKAWPAFTYSGNNSLPCLAWTTRTGDDESDESAQQCVPIDALLDVLASDKVRSIIGDIFMTLLREQEALLDLLRSNSSSSDISELPRKWWLVSQTTVAMVDRFGPAVLAKHVDVLAFVLNTMQRWVGRCAGSEPAVVSAPDDNDGKVSIEELIKSLVTKDNKAGADSNSTTEEVEEDEEKEGVLGETEMLLTVLMLLGQMMESSQQTAFAAMASSMDLGKNKEPSLAASAADQSMPAIEWNDDALRLLRRIYVQIKQICEQKAVPMVAKLASETKLQVALVLALHGETMTSSTSTDDSASHLESDNSEVVRFNAAVRDVRDDLVPVQAHGIIELRNMVLAKSPALLQNTERMDAVIAIFTDMVRSPDSYIYLNAIRGLAALADAHGRRFVPVLAEMYTATTHDGDSVFMEERLRIGEALLQSIQRAGPMLADYAADVVPRLLAAIHSNNDDKVALLTGEESSEPIVLVHSALSILSAIAQACPLALQPWIVEITATLDGMLLLPDTAIAPVLRRAAVVFWVSLLRGYGDRLLQLVDGHVLRSAYRSLRRVADSDSDELTRLHASVGIEELDDLMREQISNYLP